MTAAFGKNVLDKKLSQPSNSKLLPMQPLYKRAIKGGQRVFTIDIYEQILILKLLLIY